MPTLSPYEKEIILQTNCRKSAVELIKIVHDLWYDEAIELVIFRNSMLDKNVNEILKLHDYVTVPPVASVYFIYSSASKSDGVEF